MYDGSLSIFICKHDKQDKSYKIVTDFIEKGTS
jgi:hypothetical protein